jgi:amidophosphoribosyltransferase
MCGIVGVVARSPVNQVLYDGLLVLQHRGQDAAGIVTADGASFHMHSPSMSIHPSASCSVTTAT